MIDLKVEYIPEEKRTKVEGNVEIRGMKTAIHEFHAILEELDDLDSAVMALALERFLDKRGF